MRREERSSSTQWRAAPFLSAAVSVLAFLAPVAVSVLATVAVAHALPKAPGGAWEALWWIDVLIVPIPVFVVADQLSRRLLPLAVLLKMTMVFPDRAPKRLTVARKAGSTRDLARRIEEATNRGGDDDLALAAEQILALAASLSAHDRLTRGHSERVRVLTDLIAIELDLPTAHRDRLRWSALLHDVGKLTVHPHVLNKAEKLDEAEWAQLKNHPLEGARLTSRLAGWLGEWANTIAEHHEKFDGTGYPFALRGSQISFGGRIVAVADSYDAMTAVRSYNKPKSPAAARAELATCAGSHFDPQVVRAFLQVSVGRLRVAGGPLSWLGSLPFANGVGGMTQVAVGAGRVAVAATMVLGAGALGAIHVGTRPSHTVGASVGSLSTSGIIHEGGDGPRPRGFTAANATGIGSSPAASGSSGDTGSATKGSATKGSVVDPGPAGPASQSTDGGDPLAEGSGGSGGSTPGSTTIAAPAVSTTTRVATSTTAPSTTTSAPATTTSTTPGATTTSAPPPAPPTGLTANGSCEVVVLVPEVTLAWSASTSPSVTSYQVLRSANGSSYSVIGTLGKGTTTYGDTSVSGGTTYSYEIRG